MQPGLGRKITATAFVLSAAGTVFLLVALATLGPYANNGAPSFLWAVVLWGLVGIVTFILVMRVMVVALTAVAGLAWGAKKGAVATAHLLKALIIR